MSEKISLLLPTRGRMDKANRFLESLVARTEHPDQVEIILYFDEDDQDSHPLDCQEISTTRIIGPRLTMGGLNTACYRRATGDIIGVLNDDVIIHTPGWDRIIRDTHRKYSDAIYLAYPNDMFYGNLMCSFPFMSRKTCSILMDPFPEEYPSDFVDHHIMDIFQRLKNRGLDRIVYLEELAMEHLHPRYGKAEMDATYADRLPGGQGAEVFFGLRKYRRAASQRLLASLQGVPVPDPSRKPRLPKNHKNGFHAISRLTHGVLMDSDLPFPWRLFLFEFYTKLFFIHKYKYPVPTWQYKILKKLSPLLSFSPGNAQKPQN